MTKAIICCILVIRIVVRRRFMKIYCEKCKSYAHPVKINNNLFAIRAKCSSCGREINVTQDKAIKMVLAVLRVACYFGIAFMAAEFRPYIVDFITFIMYMPLIVLPFLALYWILAEIIVFRIK